MINEDFILSEVQKSRENKRTSPFIRKFIFKVVDESALSVYGSNYSNRCAQTSEAIKFLLNEFGIKSEIFVGSLCVLEVFRDNSKLRFCWGGFWDDESHLFNVTEYEELVDLTISQLHLATQKSGMVAYPLLPIWWQPIDSWPSIIKYLPDAPAKYGISDDDRDNYTLFMKSVVDIKYKYLSSHNIEDITFGNIIYNVASMNLLTKMGYPWLRYAHLLNDIASRVYPEFIKNKESRMIENYNSKITLSNPKLN